MMMRIVLKFCLFTAASAVAFVSCQTKPTEQIVEKPHWLFATDLLNPINNPSDLITFKSTPSLFNEISDDSIYARGSLVWQSFFIAQQEITKIFERDFLLALRTENKKFELFQKNTCYLASNSQHKLKKIVLKANSKTPEQAEGIVFTIYDSDSRDFVGVGSFDEKGFANCELPQNIKLTISTGFGEGRRETTLISGNAPQSIEVGAARAYANIRGGEMDVRDGDLVRISRVRIQRSSENEKDDDAWRHISQRIDDDFFRMIVSPTENFGASELMTSTIGVSNNTLSVPLAPGTYVAAAIERKTGRVCTQHFTVKSGETAKIGCRYRQSIQKGGSALSNNGKSILRTDATLFPSAFLNHGGMRNWLNEHGYDFVYIDNSTQTNPDIPKKYFLPVLESTLQKFDLKTSQLEIYNEVLHSYLDFNIERYLGPNLHLAETGIRHFLDSEVTPFLTTTQWVIGEPPAFQPDKNSQLLTNGTQIELTEPVVANRHLVDVLAAPRVRGRVVVPPFQKTEFLEIYINRTLSKRIVLPRNTTGAADAEFEYFFDERLDEKDDFYLTLVAWGENFLPEVIYGPGRLKPFAILMPMCFDINKNKICDAKL